MMQVPKIHGIFPEPVYESKLGRELTKKELNIINKCEIKRYKDMMNSDQFNSSQSSDNYVLEKKELKNLKEDLNKIVIDYFEKVVCTKNPIFPHITQSWINYSKPGQGLHSHSHPNSFISGVFYPSADKKVDQIKFFKGIYERIKLSYDNYNTFNSRSWLFPVETGSVFLFPSHLVHGVENKEGTNLRISLAFNVFFKGQIGDKNELTELVLE